MIDLYCERLGPGFGAEPLNAASNLAFLVAAAFLWRRHRVLAALLAGIGIGSFLFHTTATGWARALDIAGIGLFEFTLVGLYLRNVIGWGRGPTAWALVLLGASVGAARLAPEMLNGSLSYVPVLAVTFGMGWDDLRARRTHPRALLVAAAIFAFALFLRSADMAVCDGFPWGTHFLWHVGAAAVAGLAGLAYAENAKGRGA
jgi:hypothetical protein